MELDLDEVEDDGVDLGRDEILDVGNRRGFLLAGDLVELRYSSMRILPFVYFLLIVIQFCCWYTARARNICSRIGEPIPVLHDVRKMDKSIVTISTVLRSPLRGRKRA